MVILIEFLLLLIFLAVVITVVKSSLGFAPWVPTFSRDFARIFTLVKSRQGGVFLDLGCGNGRMVYAAAKQGFRAVGVELSLPMYLVCRLRQVSTQTLNVKFFLANLFQFDISQADVIYLYGLSNTLSEKFASKLIHEAKPGALILSYCFKIAGMTPIEVSRPTTKDLPIYIYKI